MHTRLCNFVWNIPTNISALERRTHLKLGELSSLFIVYNITIFLLCLLHSFLVYFLLRKAHTLYTTMSKGTQMRVGSLLTLKTTVKCNTLENQSSLLCTLLHLWWIEPSSAILDKLCGANYFVLVLI